MKGASDRMGRARKRREERGEREREKGKRKEAKEMECTQARRFFLVRVIRHDVVEINLKARDVLFHGTSGLPRPAAKVCYALAKTKLISPFEYTRRQERGSYRPRGKWAYRRSRLKMSDMLKFHDSKNAWYRVPYRMKCKRNISPRFTINFIISIMSQYKYRVLRNYCSHALPLPLYAIKKICFAILICSH